MNALSRCQLDWRLDSITEGDGNCFPRAVVQQCQRVHVQENLGNIQKYNSKNHRSLRTAVCQFMLNPGLPCIENYKKTYMENVFPETRMFWEDYWIGMSQDKVWVDDKFIQGTAWYLCQDIWIATTGSTPEQPYITYSGNSENQTMPCPGIPLLIGYQLNLHYQSLLPSRESQESTQLDFRIEEFPPLGSKPVKKRMRLDGKNQTSTSTYNRQTYEQWTKLKPRENLKQEEKCPNCKSIVESVPIHFKKSVICRQTFDRITTNDKDSNYNQPSKKGVVKMSECLQDNRKTKL